MTRYDGWFLAGVIGATIVVIAARQWENRTLRTGAVKFLFGISVAPVLWLVYNHIVYGNALEFANGPYSAKAIEQRVGAPNPAFHNAGTAAVYFLKSAQLNMADGNWGRFWLGGGPSSVCHRSLETADAGGIAVAAVGAARVLRALDRLWFGASSRPHLVAV